MKLNELGKQIEDTLSGKYCDSQGGEDPDALRAIGLLFEYVQEEAKINSLIRKYDRVCADIDFAQLKGDVTLAAELSVQRDKLLVEIGE